MIFYQIGPLILPVDLKGEVQLREMAESQGMGVTQLARAWVIECLELERRRPATANTVLWQRTRATVEEMLPEIVARVASNTK